MHQNNDKLSTSPNECHYTTLWNTTCVNLFITTIMQALNVMKIGSYGQTHHNKCSKCLPLALTSALRRFRRWLIAWSVMLCWIPDHAKIVSYRHFHWMSLCMMRPTDLRKMPVSLAIWRVVLRIHGAPSRLSAKSMTVSIFSAVRDVRGVPLPSCQSVVAVSRSFLRR